LVKEISTFVSGYGIILLISGREESKYCEDKALKIRERKDFLEELINSQTNK